MTCGCWHTPIVRQFRLLYAPPIGVPQKPAHQFRPLHGFGALDVFAAQLVQAAIFSGAISEEYPVAARTVSTYLRIVAALSNAAASRNKRSTCSFCSFAMRSRSALQPEAGVACRIRSAGIPYPFVFWFTAPSLALVVGEGVLLRLVATGALYHSQRGEQGNGGRA
jgi:hypothetical protein